MNDERVSIDKLIGEVFVEAFESYDNRELILIKDNGDKYVFYHEQDCCEDVHIKEITGDLADLLYVPITVAEETTSGYCPTWTFYKFATKKGYVDVSWVGQSNGYYSESVTIDFVPKFN